ncbi:hypothetical protein [Nocardiopsis synnemataformans]|uniref:hypothetical protein n=1 Tax=Nocardiopsis synnemataformans TaxID=61305 RepID=UPI003EBA6C38
MSTTNAMTIDIESIRERAEAATEGPWDVTSDGGTIRTDYPSGTPGDCTVIVEDSRDFHDPDGPRTEDMWFLAAARQDIPALLAEVDRLHARVADLEKHQRGTDQLVAGTARSMRERSADEVARHWPRLTDKRPAAEKCADVMDAVRALPLLSDDDTRVADVHVATPEGITPCEKGRHDVNVTTIISHVTCRKCLRTLAQLNGTSARALHAADTDA